MGLATVLDQALNQLELGFRPTVLGHVQVVVADRASGDLLVVAGGVEHGDARDLKFLIGTDHLHGRVDRELQRCLEQSSTRGVDLEPHLPERLEHGVRVEDVIGRRARIDPFVIGRYLLANSWICHLKPLDCCRVSLPRLKGFAESVTHALGPFRLFGCGRMAVPWNRRARTRFFV